MQNSAPNLSAMRAAQYVRMSTESQKYSIENQAATIAIYAAARGIEISKTYADDARSGLTLNKRPALVQLISDVTSGRADFEMILVYDVSRWGRFQDTDESAHYEFICKMAGVPVHYCAEIFEQEGIFQEEGLAGALFKLLKRAMAAEYSRELSVKVFAGQSRMASRGFYVGGKTPYGLARMLVTDANEPKAVLLPGQRKSLRDDRVVLVPGPSSEIETVQRIFDLYAVKQHSMTTIAEILNAEGIPARSGRIWRWTSIRSILMNENVIGNVVYNRRSQSLGGPSKRNPREKWIVCEGALQPLVDRERFNDAQSLRMQRGRKLSNSEVVSMVKGIYKKTGHLTADLLRNSPDLPYEFSYQLRFGGFRKLYAMLGHPAPRSFSLLDKPGVARASAWLRENVMKEIDAGGAHAVWQRQRGFLLIQNIFTLRIIVVPAFHLREHYYRWVVRTKIPHEYHGLLAARMDRANSQISGCFLLPNFGASRNSISLKASKASRYEEYKISSLATIRRLSELIAGGDPLPKTTDDFRRLICATDLPT